MRITIEIFMKVVPKGPTDKKSSSVQIITSKVTSLPEQMVIPSTGAYVCVTQVQ